MDLPYQLSVYLNNTYDLIEECSLACNRISMAVVAFDDFKQYYNTITSIKAHSENIGTLLDVYEEKYGIDLKVGRDTFKRIGRDPSRFGMTQLRSRNDHNISLFERHLSEFESAFARMRNLGR